MGGSDLDDMLELAGADPANPPPSGGSSGRLFDQSECFYLVVGWVVFWYVCHNLLWVFWQRGRLPLFCQSMQDRYRRRLCRSQVYCALAVISGVRLLSFCRWDAIDLLHIFTVEHQVAFTMAVGHWLVAIWEDMQCWRMLSAGMDSSVAEVESEEATARFLGQAYIVHHIVAALCFWLVVRLQSCVGIGLFGLVFELPVLLMNHREFAVCMQPRPDWFRDTRRLSRFWRDLMFLYAVGRIGPAVVYVYSVLFWEHAFNSLSFSERFVYHFAAIFFTMLNRGLAVILASWRRSDFEFLHRTQKTWDFSTPEQTKGAQIFEASNSLEESIWALEEAPVAQPKELKDIPEEQFYVQQGAVYQQGQYWIEIDGIVYDVSSFLSKHPGGEATLRKYHGKDATEAFHRTKHSMRARKLMQDFIIGRVVRPLRKYRIFELGFGPILNLCRDSLQPFVALGLLAPRSLVGWSLEFPSSSSGIGLLVPGLLLCAITGAVPTIGCRCFAAHCNRMSGQLGFCFTLQCVGFMICRRPLPDTLSWACPTGLEIGAVGLLAAEEVVDFFGGERRHFSWRGLIPLTLLAISWNWRGAWNLPALALEQLLGAGLFTTGSFGLFHSMSNRQIPAIEEGLVAMTCAFLCSASALIALHFQGSEVSEAVAAIRRNPSMLQEGVLTALAIVGVAHSLMTSLDQQMKASASWASRFNAIMVLICTSLSGGWNSGCWILWFAALAHAGAVSARKRLRHDELEATAEFQKLPSIVPLTRSFWDYTRAVDLTLLWVLISIPLTKLVLWTLPQELTVWSYEMPIFHLGRTVNYGVAAYFCPPKSKLEQEAPAHFDVKTRHVDITTEAGEHEAIGGVRAMRRKWERLKRSDPKGLAANVVMMYPGFDRGSLWKEISLTSWQSEAEAKAWEARERVPSDSRFSNRAGSAMAAALAAQNPPDVEATADEPSFAFKLRPRGPLRHQDRCKKCFRLVESDHVGLRAPEKCKACKGNAYGYTFF